LSTSHAFGQVSEHVDEPAQRGPSTSEVPCLRTVPPQSPGSWRHSTSARATRAIRLVPPGLWLAQADNLDQIVAVHRFGTVSPRVQAHLVKVVPVFRRRTAWRKHRGSGFSRPSRRHQASLRQPAATSAASTVATVVESDGRPQPRSYRRFRRSSGSTWWIRSTAIPTFVGGSWRGQGNAAARAVRRARTRARERVGPLAPCRTRGSNPLRPTAPCFRLRRSTGPLCLDRMHRPATLGLSRLAGVPFAQRPGGEPPG
jgi:hypothetical protein